MDSTQWGHTSLDLCWGGGGAWLRTRKDMWEGRGGRGDERQGKKCGVFDVAYCCRRPPHASVACHVADDAGRDGDAQECCSIQTPLVSQTRFV